MSIQALNRRIDGIIKNKQMLIQSTLNQHQKDTRKGTADALVSICSVHDEEALFLTDRIMAIPPADSKMNSHDIISFFENNYGVRFK